MAWRTTGEWTFWDNLQDFLVKIFNTFFIKIYFILFKVLTYFRKKYLLNFGRFFSKKLMHYMEISKKNSENIGTAKIGKKDLGSAGN